MFENRSEMTKKNLNEPNRSKGNVREVLTIDAIKTAPTNFVATRAWSPKQREFPEAHAKLSTGAKHLPPSEGPGTGFI